MVNADNLNTTKNSLWNWQLDQESILFNGTVYTNEKVGFDFNYPVIEERYENLDKLLKDRFEIFGD